MGKLVVVTVQLRSCYPIMLLIKLLSSCGQRVEQMSAFTSLKNMLQVTFKRSLGDDLFLHICHERGHMSPSGNPPGFLMILRDFCIRERHLKKIYRNFCFVSE